MNVTNGGSEQRIEFLQGILEIDPKNVAALVELGWSLAEDAHDEAQGVIALEQALEIAPDSLEANFWLAKIYYHLLPGNTARAKETLERALAADPSYPAAASLYGALCWELNAPDICGTSDCDPIEPERALTHLRAAYESETSWVALPNGVDEILTQLNRVPEAIEFSKRAFRLARHFLKLSTPSNQSYYESCITHRWVDKEFLARLQWRAARKAG